MICFAELSLLEPHLLPDITTQLLSMAAACLSSVFQSCFDFIKFLVISIICKLKWCKVWLLSYFRGLHWWYLFKFKPEKQKWPFWVQVCDRTVDWMESGREVLYLLYLLRYLFHAYRLANFNHQSCDCFSLPVARSAHGATVYNDKLWIFAGYDGNARYVWSRILLVISALWFSAKSELINVLLLCSGWMTCGPSICRIENMHAGKRPVKWLCIFKE